ncbi:hypothetical protein DYY66_0140 [Candidatus Nitrosotalea sp. FS]|uniref:hypothetical protein n=1 Tax=Candidatus Nitrosotalea sp. FS TaxID=2341021 RepID=UPI00140DAEFC|nr:hypothetical protein [Candidatus Nitrosotalea sp. FS]NHH98424.1 hypothetical protein [Candidatus Nitrosotalea sp. FS]
MSVIEIPSNPSLVEMWQFIDRNLNPIGMMPDKASLDYMQTCRLYLRLRKQDSKFRDTVQAQILKNELARSLLDTLVN